MSHDPDYSMRANIYRRLQIDGLIGPELRRYKALKEQQADERGFQFWQNDTLMPDVVNRHIKEIGDES